MAKVVVVGLGPAGPELVPSGVYDAVARIAHRYLRTTRHLSASVVGEAVAFDALYERAQTLDDVYDDIVDALVAAADEHGEVLYAVPGSPLVAEHTVALLLADERVEVEVVVAPSFLDLAWARLGVDPIGAGVRLVDGRRFATEAAGERGPLLVAQCDSQLVLSDVKLAVDAATSDVPAEAVVLHHLGLSDEWVGAVAWSDLDSTVDADHLTSVYIPVLAAPVSGELARFVELVATLRHRCPWDREQTHRSLTRHLVEETYELIEAIDALDDTIPQTWVHLEEELGDLLFQVVFHATLAAEEGAFGLADVARTVHDKLVGRHPHVFGNVVADTPGQVMANWEQIKKSEKGRTSLMQGIPAGLPSLLYAHKVTRKAASVGLEWPLDDAVTATLGTRPDSEEFGRHLFAVADVARRVGVDPEAALRATVAAFAKRFLALERLADADGIELAGSTAADVRRLWDAVD